MRNYFTFIGLLFLFVFSSFSQENWELLKSVETGKILAWDVDPMSKVIYAKNDALIKLDTSFNVQFTQSVKGFGAVTKIDARHSLKTLIFSEDQQSVAFIDNTLTFHKGIKDLSLLNVSYATNVSYSAQSNRYWVFDDDNSKLLLVDENRRAPQVIENLQGTLGSLSLFQLLEMENVLLIFDRTLGIYLFDIYGSMIDFIETSEAKSIHFADGRLYYMTDDELVRINIKNRNVVRIPLPEKDLVSFRVLGRYIFFQTPTHIKKYFLKKVR